MSEFTTRCADLHAILLYCVHTLLMSDLPAITNSMIDGFTCYPYD